MNQYPQTLLPAKLNHPTQLQQELHGASCEGQSAVQDEPRKPAQQQQTNQENRSGSWGCQPPPSGENTKIQIPENRRREKRRNRPRQSHRRRDSRGNPRSRRRLQNPSSNMSSSGKSRTSRHRETRARVSVQSDVTESRTTTRPGEKQQARRKGHVCNAHTLEKRRLRNRACGDSCHTARAHSVRAACDV